MSQEENEQFVRDLFEQRRERPTEILSHLTDDVGSIMEEAKAIYEKMIPDMPYIDQPITGMAMNVFSCAPAIAVYVAARHRGVDVHDFGNALLAAMRPPPAQPQQDDTRPGAVRFAPKVAAGAASQGREDTGEFVFEVIVGDGVNYSWGMNVTSCGVCHLADKYDALDLVPYLCASDDVVSDHQNSGLRRSGTIAVGAHQCDFRYKDGGEPRRLADQYPDKIRLQKV